MAQHSPRFPACPECRHHQGAEAHGRICLDCTDADRFDPIYPGESGEVVDYAAWADDSLAACAESRRPLAARTVPPGTSWAFTHHRTLAQVLEDEGVSRQEIELGNALGRAACTDGIPKPEVIREPVPAWPPYKIKQD